jgi:hypothetical protein
MSTRLTLCTQKDNSSGITDIPLRRPHKNYFVDRLIPENLKSLCGKYFQIIMKVSTASNKIVYDGCFKS